MNNREELVVPYHSFRCHEVKTTLNNCLVELHAAKNQIGDVIDNQLSYDVLGNTIHQKPSHPVVTVIDGNSVTCLVQLVGAGEASRS